MSIIEIARDFSPAPAGRFRRDGPDSGERFREDYLKPALAKSEFVSVRIDGTAGYGSSFLDEAFGGLVRSGFLDPNEALRRIRIVYADQEFEMYRDVIVEFIRDAGNGPDRK